MLDTAAFDPDWASPPGVTIADILAARSLSREHLAKAIDVPLEAVQRILLGLDSIDGEIAHKLSGFLGSSPSFWLRREEQYQSDLERFRQAQTNVAEEAWVKQFPLREMTNLGWIPQSRSLAEAAKLCLKFFDVPNVPSWHERYAGNAKAVAFRISSSGKTEPGSVCAWLRWAELVASRTPTAAWDPETFRRSLPEIRRLSWLKRPSIFLPRLRKICAASGVSLVVARTPKGCPASGATRFLGPTRALIVLSFRYRSDDQFWFTFFHEAGHLLLHGPDALFLEDGSEVTSLEESEANLFAERVLIPEQHADEFANMHPTRQNVISFSRRVGVAPGVVVGQLQHKKIIGHESLARLKRRYVWDEIEVDQLIP
jgi:HTH-type transcriptional regulator/antitoxin HigA